MIHELSELFTNICIGYFGINKQSRVAITYNLYDVGCIQYYEQKRRFCLWCNKSSGIFACLLQPSDHLLGYVLLIDNNIVEFFTHYGDPLDWWEWNSRKEDVRRPFHLDQGFRCLYQE